MHADKVLPEASKVVAHSWPIDTSGIPACQATAVSYQEFNLSANL
jgi:hypothetical protein